MAQDIWGAELNRSPYYNQGNYGASQNMYDSPLVSGNNNDSLINQSPQALYYRMTAPYAGGQDAFSRFVQGQYQPIMQQGFKAAQMTNPNLNPADYLTGLGGQDFFRRQYMNLAARDRGIQAPNFGGGRMRWFGQFG